MRYQPLLFPGVIVLAIASLLIVQSCTNKQDRAGTDRDLEQAGMLAIAAIQKCYNAKHAANCKSLEQPKSIIQSRCESRDQAACELLINIQKLHGDAIVVEGMEGGPTQKPFPKYPG